MIYEVTSPVLLDGEMHEVGEPIDLTKKQAAEIPWAVKALDEPKKGKKSDAASNAGATGNDSAAGAAS